MRKTIAFFFLTGALFLVIGHSILPHNHTKGICSQCISNEERHSFSDIILHSLAQNLGANHLEEFSNQQKVRLNTNLHIRVEVISSEIIDLHIIDLSQTDQIHFLSTSEPIVQHEFQNKGLRAPPVHA